MLQRPLAGAQQKNLSTTDNPSSCSKHEIFVTMPFGRCTFSTHLRSIKIQTSRHLRYLSKLGEKTMEHVEAIQEETSIEHQELSVADLDMTALYEWLDRPVTEDDYELNV